MAKKPITISIKSDFGWFWPISPPYTLKTGIFMPFFQLSSAFLVRRDFENIAFDFVWIFPIYVTKNFHKIKTSVKIFSKVLLKIYWNFKKVVFYLLEKNHCTQYGPEKVTFIFFGQNTCHVLELCEKINWISLKAFLWRPLKKRQYFLRWCNFYDVYCKTKIIVRDKKRVLC